MAAVPPQGNGKFLKRLANDYSMKVKLIGLATFLIPYQLVFLVTGFDETFVYIEVFSIVMALYAAVEKKKLLFVIAMKISGNYRLSIKNLIL